MNITIKLSKHEVAGIKNYLKDVDGIDKPTKNDVSTFIQGYIDAIHSPREAVSDYIKKEFSKTLSDNSTVSY